MLRGVGYEVHRLLNPPSLEVFAHVPQSNVENLQVTTGEHCVELCYTRRSSTAETDGASASTSAVQHSRLVFYVPSRVTTVRQFLCAPGGRVYVQLSTG